MPRITEERREARRAGILAAARRCFARDGFHQTSMPDIAREAGLSAGAFYRYFPGKEEVILEIAGQAFGTMAGRLGDVLAAEHAPTVADLVVAVVGPLGEDTITAPDGSVIETDELARCAVQAWGEVLRHDDLGARARAGFEFVLGRVAAVIHRGQEAGTVPDDLDPDGAARVVMAIAPGFVLQRTAFGLTDTAGFLRAVRALLGG